MESMPYITCFKLFVNINVVIMSKWDIDEFCTDPPRPRCFLPKILSQGGGGGRTIQLVFSMSIHPAGILQIRSGSGTGHGSNDSDLLVMTTWCLSPYSSASEAAQLLRYSQFYGECD